MEFKRNSVIALYLTGKSQATIVRELQHLHVNKMFVYRTITRYNDTGSIAKRHGGGHKKTATSSEMVRKVKARIQRNPGQSAMKLAKKLNVSDSSIRRILKNELHLKPYMIKGIQYLKDEDYDDEEKSTKKKAGRLKKQVKNKQSKESPIKKRKELKVASNKAVDGDVTKNQSESNPEDSIEEDSEGSVEEEDEITKQDSS